MPAAVAVIRQLPAPTMVNTPVEAFTVHTLEGVAEYDTDPRAPLGAVTLGAAEPNVTDEALYRNPLNV